MNGGEGGSGGQDSEPDAPSGDRVPDAPDGPPAPAESPESAPAVAPPAAPSVPPPTVKPPAYPDKVSRKVWGRAERAEILDSIAAMPVIELQDLLRRWKIVFALNGLAPEFRSLSAAERLRIVDHIVEVEDRAGLTLSSSERSDVVHALASQGSE